MKTWRTIQKIAVAVGMSYGLWLGTNVNATDADSRNAFVIIALSAIIQYHLCRIRRIPQLFRNGLFSKPEFPLSCGSGRLPGSMPGLAQIKEKSF